jgi:hypothetical protein
LEPVPPKNLEKNTKMTQFKETPNEFPSSNLLLGKSQSAKNTQQLGENKKKSLLQIKRIIK